MGFILKPNALALAFAGKSSVSEEVTRKYGANGGRKESERAIFADVCSKIAEQSENQHFTMWR